MNFDDPVNPARQLHRISLQSLEGDAVTDRVRKSIRIGRIYEACVEILRTQAASGLDYLDDSCIKGMGFETLFDDNMTFIAAIALSRPTLDYESLLTYAFGVREAKDIIKSLERVISKFSYTKSFYHFLIAQNSHDKVLTKIFNLDSQAAPRLVAPHGDPSAIKRLAKVFRQDFKTMTDNALAHFPDKQASRFRERLTGSAAMSNFEFTERLTSFFWQKGGFAKGLFDDETEGSCALEEIMGMPNFEKNIIANAGEVMNGYFKVLRGKSGRGDSKGLGALEEIEREIIGPLLKGSGDRMVAFYTLGHGKSHSWLTDIQKTRDGGRQHYLQMLIDGALSDETADNMLARAFIRLEPANDLLALCEDDKAVSKLYALTANTQYLKGAASAVLDKALGQDLGL
ncbi:hypothetical protein [Pseudomonas amygdali]|uniref:Uncharacterized protein n=2 Tax=Pseudomonas amygdali pv. lachrymans TaxID=53707 RepID=A0ABR5KR83_PSEAV|nr:hypothetical protein [Pseudomonas amygdali]AXH59819.1 hypothetical protein PLA107_031845 [Pseudomonas amygdali pv. lachrymans str. M301315]KPC17237.1 Uncharacterized protein AC499_0439 [Pseudomonas amygdali pv. lachrymans]KPC18196.1 Uncharacterized protein AC499_1398 [Pseudomonas amygdali pv. lachrymans]